MITQGKIPVGRFGKPDDIASVVELLVANSYLTNKASDTAILDSDIM